MYVKKQIYSLARLYNLDMTNVDVDNKGNRTDSYVLVVSHFDILFTFNKDVADYSSLNPF